MTDLCGKKEVTMGKQIIFYMDYETEAKFFEYLLPQCKISNRVENGKMMFVDELPERFSGQKGWIKLLLYKPEMGSCDIVNFDDGRGFVNQDTSPVIEFWRSIIDPADKTISQGRIYVIMKYFDKEENYVSKPEELDKWYKELCKWIRKHVPRNMGYYISDSIWRLLKEEGYHTR